MGGRTTGDEDLRQPIDDVPDYPLPGRGQTAYTVSAFSRTGAGKNTSKFKRRVRPASAAGLGEIPKFCILWEVLEIHYQGLSLLREVYLFHREAIK